MFLVDLYKRRGLGKTIFFIFLKFIFDISILKRSKKNKKKTIHHIIILLSIIGDRMIYFFLSFLTQYQKLFYKNNSSYSSIFRRCLRI